MLRKLAAATLAGSAALTALTLVSPTAAHAAPTYAELAARWAPVHRQDTDSSDTTPTTCRRSTSTASGTPSTSEPRDSVARLTGRSYYSVVQTSTHWFVVYGYYHPRDWSELCSDTNCHENDLEGLLLTVRKDGTTYGKLEAAVTVAHTNFYSYVPAGSTFVSGRESVDGTLRMQTYGGVSHPVTFQEAKGHGLKGWDGSGFPGGDGVIYYPSGTAEVPSSGTDASVGYGLTDIFASGGMWSRRADTTTFTSGGAFQGNTYKDDAANAPWAWDDSDDGSDLQKGLLAKDPAYLVQQYFDGTGSFSLTYLDNGYTG